MKTYAKIAFGLWVWSVTAALTCAQVTLTGISYTQNFDSLGTASGAVSLPSGWSVTSNATTSLLGTLATSVSRVSWADTPGGGRNVASATGLTGTESTTVQHAAADRALGYRQTTIGDPGAAFVFNAETTGLKDFSLTFDFMTLDVEARTTTWLVQVSADGTSWIGLNTTPSSITDAGGFGTQSITASALPSLIDNQASVYFRIAALAETLGSGSRDTIAIDNFSLSYSAIPEPSTYAAIAGLLAITGVVIGRRRRAVDRV